MDRNRGSSTFGCLSRPFWHDKVTDFPSAHQQIGVLPLTIAYREKWDGNPFYQEERIRECIEAGMQYWAEIQKKDGSFDEHYPNEHSLGAVAWTLWAITESYLLLDDPPSIEDGIDKAVDFMERNDEPGDIANHQAVAASALVNAHRITGRGKGLAKKRLETLCEMQSDEGWFQEYAGPDIGYQSTTISHLGRVWKQCPGMVDDQMLKQALDFFSDFIDGENYYSGIIGSRNTEHIHAAGFEILADEFEQAEKISGAIRKNRESGRLLNPGQMDDKHFSRQLAEYLDAYRLSREEVSSVTEAGQNSYEHITVWRSEDDIVFVNLSKGGVFKHYKSGRLVNSDTSIAVEKDSEVYTANWPESTDSFEDKDSKIVVEGNLRRVPRNTLSGYRFLASRLFNYSVGRSAWLSLKAKNILIKLLIGADRGGISFRRELDLESLEVSDEVNGERIEGKVRSNFVPSSEFFKVEELDSRG